MRGLKIYYNYTRVCRKSCLQHYISKIVQRMALKFHQNNFALCIYVCERILLCDVNCAHCAPPYQ